MNIALIGYGRMGHEIEAIAIQRGHKVNPIIDVGNMDDFVPGKFDNVDAVIEFTSPESAFENVIKCLEMKKPVVSGSTGWSTKYELAAEKCRLNDTSFIHSSNFSIGVNILFRLNALLAGMMEGMDDYRVSIEEIHHTRKLDAPSGTAISLAKGIVENHRGYKGWTTPEKNEKDSLVITSVREGLVPGTHTVTWDSEIDTLSLKHEAKGRKGFALGAVLAAEYISKRKGVFTMKDILGF
jgi:4-hydroxy-tetrahydrodipicolinate reductase